MAGKYWDDINVGDRFATARKTVTETAITVMNGLAGLTELLFTDEEFAQQTHFKGKIAPGPLTLYMMLGLWQQLGTFSDTAMGLLLFDKVKFVAPVRPGDTIRAEVELIEKKETPKSDRGVARWHWKCTNQKNEVVVEMESANLVRRRNA